MPNTKKTGIDLELLVIAAIRRELARIPVQRRLKVFEYVRDSVLDAALAREKSQAEQQLDQAKASLRQQDLAAASQQSNLEALAAIRGRNRGLF